MNACLAHLVQQAVDLVVVKGARDVVTLRQNVLLELRVILESCIGVFRKHDESVWDKNLAL
jgi:hypothetical protein